MRFGFTCMAACNAAAAATAELELDELFGSCPSCIECDTEGCGGGGAGCGDGHPSDPMCPLPAIDCPNPANESYGDP